MPKRLSTEPSIAIQQDGDIAVSGLATDADPTVAARGGYVWVSRDRAENFTLERGRAVPAERPVGCAACDTTLVAREGRFVLGTYYFEVNPAFDVSIAQSSGDGSEWRTLHPGAAREQPIDRPWLATGDNGTLLLVYRRQSGIQNPPGAPPGDKAGRVYAQWGSGRPGSWSQPTLLIAPDEGERDRAVNFVKPELVEGRALVPIRVSTNATGYRNVTGYILSHDPETGGWQQRKLVPNHPHFAEFSYSLDANENGTVVIAWTAPAGPGGTSTVHARVSHDAGRSWGPIRVLDEVPGSALQPWVAVRDDGLVAVSYHGSNLTGSPLNATEKTPWWPRAVLFDASAPSEPMAVAQLNQAPIYRGVLCNGSPRCPEGAESVPMKEFLSAAWGPDGSLYTAFTNTTAEQPPSRTNRDDEGQNLGRLTVTRLDVNGTVAGQAGGSADMLGDRTVIPQLGTR